MITYMKNLKRYRLVFLLLLSRFASLAQEPVSFHKEYNFHYDTLNKERLFIYNRYGKVEVSTWNRPEIQVHVVVSSKALSLEDAKAVAARVSVIDRRRRDSITCGTKIAP